MSNFLKRFLTSLVLVPILFFGIFKGEYIFLLFVTLVIIVSFNELSKIIIKKYNGRGPENFEDLENLPGVGHKTASVVMSQGFGYPAFPVDTHIHRLAQRWGLTNGKNVVQTELDIKKLFPEATWNRLHLQMIFYGREYCKARSCFGVECKICTDCYPNRRKAIKVKKP